MPDNQGFRSIRYTVYMFLLEILIAYIVFVFVFTRVFVPHLGFTKDSIPSELPLDVLQTLSEYNRLARDNSEFLKLSYEFVTNKYQGSRLKTLTQFHRAFGNAFQKIPGFLPCTGQNYILRTFLVRSGRFQESDIEVKTVPLNLFIHQYLRVKIGDTFIDVDPWSHFLGVPLGKKSAIIG